MLRVAGRGLVARRALLSLPQRAMSSGGGFDGENSMLYQKMFEQHLHPNGPWMKMVAATKQAIGPSGSGVVVDVATGPGEPANLIARELPNATVIATDISDDMVDKAKARMDGLSNVKFLTLDVQNMSSIESDSVDVVTACYGYMFPADKELALKETLRILKPGGCLIATYWVDVKFLKLLGAIMTAVLGGPPPPPPANPLSLAEPGLFDGLAVSAGFDRVTTTYDAYPFNVGQEPDFQYKISTMLVKEKLDELNGHEVARKTLFEKMDDFAYTAENGDKMLGPNKYAMAVLYKKGAPTSLCADN